jgi:hypothetical protein
MSVHNALDRVIASGADKHLSLVTKIVIGMRATSRQGRPLAAIRTGWSINCAKASRLQSLIRHAPNPPCWHRVGMWLEDEILVN